MASMGDKGFKQDLIVSARFKNDLPPPPMPPKFLDIDTGGIENYLTTSFASSVARREEPNIDVDGEGGMPIDMIGVPGYFFGDESAIMAPERPPVLDPADQELLLSINQIKSQSATQNISFLRKTQYLSTSSTRSSDMFTKNTRARQPLDRKVEPVVDRDDKENVTRHVQKGFDLAYPDSIPYNEPGVKLLQRTPAEREAWDRPKHPSGNKEVFPVDFYPVLPDFEATTDQGGVWQRLKFDKPPIPADHNRRDDRVDVATFQTIQNEALMPEWQAKAEAFARDPENYEDPGPEPHIWVLAIPTSEDVPRVRKFLYDGHPDKDDPALVEPLLAESLSGQMRVPFHRKRVFQSVTQTSVDQRRFVAVGLYDPNSNKNNVPPSDAKRKQGKAAYFYPIAENVRFKTDRSKIAHPAIAADVNQPLADVYMLYPRQLDEREAYDRVELQGRYDYAFVDKYEQLQQAALAAQEAAEAEEKIQEDRTVEDGPADVTMDEVRDVEDAGVVIDQTADTRPARDENDDDDDDALADGLNGHGPPAARHRPGSSDEELMEDD